MKPMNPEMRKSALRRYLVLRVKLIEFLDLNAVLQGINSQQFTVSNPVGRIPSDFAAALRTVQLSWFAVLIDKSKDGMDATKLWIELFPEHRVQIEDVWTQIESAWITIRAFRDKAGFHADKPIAFFKARNDVLLERQSIDAAIKKFQDLLRVLLNAEAKELPDLYQAVDEFLDELEETNQLKYKRADFKRYLMLSPPVADTSTVL
jgi:hypothetical protein